MGQLSIRVLGAPEVYHEGRPLKFRSRKVLALLLYLAVEGKRVSREKLRALLWPESGEEAARSTLRRALADLRIALDDSPAHTHLATERDALAFAPLPGDEVDARQVEVAFDLLRHPVPSREQSEERRALLQQLHQADELARGDFMEGFTLDDAPDFEQWIREQRATWHRRWSLICERVAQMQDEQGDTANAVDTVNGWLARDPLSEPAYRHLMLLYLSVGDYRAALAAYEDCRRVLAEKLQRRPLSETSVLAERVRRAAGRVGGTSTGVDTRQHAHPPDAHQGRPYISGGSTPAPTHAAFSGGVSQAGFSMPLVGRASEHVAMVEIYREVQRGVAHVVLVNGEAGIGKTQLTQNFLGWVTAQGADVLQARAFETGGRLPYQPLVECFRPRLERENAPDDLLSDIWLAELARLLPELRERYPDLPLASEDDLTARARLYEALTRLGLALAEKAPLVIFVDDLHWADAATLDVLHYAARHWHESSAPLLLLLTMRSESSGAALSEWMAGLEGAARVTHLQLEALSFEETLHLLEALALEHDTREQVETFGRWLFAETGGQPLYITETLKALIERGMLARVLEKDGGWHIDFRASAVSESALRRFLPPGVREVIRVRLNRLTPDAFALLVAGAVLGRDASFEQLCMVSGIDKQAALTALDELLRSRFLREGSGGDAGIDFAGDGSGTYFFGHDKVRDVVYSEAGEARRHVFHRCALQGLRSSPPAERARHALAAGLHAQAFELYLAASEEAMQVFAVRDAIPLYEQARRLLPRLAEPTSPLLAQQLYSQLGRAYELTSRTEDAWRAYQEMLVYAQKAGLPAMECMALSRMAILEVQFRGDFEQAKALLQQALRKAEEVGDQALIADVEWHLAQLGSYTFDSPAIAMHSLRALGIARKLGDTELAARCLNALSYGEKRIGHMRAAEGYAREGLALYQQLGNRAMEVDCVCMLASIEFNRGRIAEGIALAQRAYKVSLDIGNAWGQVNSMYHLALGALEQGAYEQARDLAQRCVALTEEFQLHVLQANMYSLLGIVQRSLGKPDEARASHLKALELAKIIASNALITMAASELCADEALLGNWEEAAALALDVVNRRSASFVMVFELSRWYVTEALIRAGYLERAREDLERWRARIEECFRHHIPYLRAVAALADAEGEPDKARAALREALSLAQEQGIVSEQQEIEAVLKSR